MNSFVDSLVAPLSLLNALLVQVSMNKQEEVVGSFRRLESIWDEYHVYQNARDRAGQ